MLFLDTILDTLAENLALDEALLLQAEDGGPEVFRLWEAGDERRRAEPREGPNGARNPAPHGARLAATHSVVLGAGCKLAEDVDETACRTAGIPIGRRGSGGGTVVLGPGCLVYSLVLSMAKAPQLANLHSSYRWILEHIRGALAPAGIDLQLAGTSDLVLGDRKVSGNAQQRKLRHLLHHGTLLYDFDAGEIFRVLRTPVRQPEYRRQRSHGDFLGSLPMTAAEIRQRLCAVWNAHEAMKNWPGDRVRRLVKEKYGREEWVRRR